MAPWYACGAPKEPTKKKESRTFKCPDGLKIDCYDSWHSQKMAMFVWNEIFGFHTYEFGEQALKEGDVVFDVGANVGLCSVRLGKVGPKNLTVHAFEPIPQVASFARTNVARHCPDTFKVHTTALGAEDGEAEITYYPDQHIASNMAGITREIDPKRVNDVFEFFGTIKNPRAQMEYYALKLVPSRLRAAILNQDIKASFSKRQRCVIKIRTLSSMIRELDVKKIDFLKIDVEGSELNVFKGIDDEHWPMIKRIVVDIEKDYEEITAMLQARGFKTKITQSEADPCAENMNLRAWREEDMVIEASQ